VINSVISSKLSTSTLIEQVSTLSYTQYVADTNIAHISYIKNFLREGAEYNAYPLTASYIKQVHWLYQNSKKAKDIWLAKLIITNYLTGNQQSIVYELDATSSGIQLVGILTKSNQLAELSNVTGTEYQDIYRIFSTDFKVELEKACTFLKAFIKEMNMGSIENILSNERIQSLAEANTFGKCLEYFSYCDYETLPVLSKNISKTVAKLLANKKWKQLIIRYSGDIYWMFSSKLREFCKEIPKSNTAYFIKLLVNARIVFEYYAVIHDNKWIDLENRNLYKKPLSARINMRITYKFINFKSFSEIKKYIK
jgi:hypothetical protein